MKKKITFYLRFFCVIMVLVCITGCGTVVTPTIPPTVIVTPSATFTPAPPYIHYTPPKDANVHIEFDYPGYWYFNESKLQYVERYSIFLSDPLVFTLPTKDPNQSHGNPDSYGRIYIWIEPLKNGQTLDNIVNSYSDGSQKSTNYLVWLRDYFIEIDGQDAYVFEIHNSIPESYSSTMFERTILFVTKNMMYRINFVVSVDERGGEFEKGYEYFLDSLKVVE